MGRKGSSSLMIVFYRSTVSSMEWSSFRRTMYAVELPELMMLATSGLITLRISFLSFVLE